jgi:Probable zinc-ribbon domain
MDQPVDRYAEFVEHPRLGRHPRLTGLNPNPKDQGVHLHWCVNWNGNRLIPNTAVLADLTRQTPATVQVTHYFDLERECNDCKRLFIFFAEEQKYWYEELGFGLDSLCTRCIDCRKKQQAIAQQRKIYESLIHLADKNEQQILDMAHACLYLMEHKIFTLKQTQQVRALFKLIPKEAEIRTQPRFSDLLQRLLVLEGSSAPAP